MGWLGGCGVRSEGRNYTRGCCKTSSQGFNMKMHIFSFNILSAQLELKFIMFNTNFIFNYIIVYVCNLKESL